MAAGRRWGSYASKAAMWATKAACSSCGAETGAPCTTRSGGEASYPHGGRKALPEHQPPTPPRRRQLDPVAAWHQRHIEGIARRQAEQERARPSGGPSLQLKMVVPMWNPFPSKG